MLIPYKSGREGVKEWAAGSPRTITLSLERSFRSVQQYMGKCADCETGNGCPVLRGEYTGNMQATYPFQIIAMDHTPSPPGSFEGKPRNYFFGFIYFLDA